MPEAMQANGLAWLEPAGTSHQHQHQHQPGPVQACLAAGLMLPKNTLVIQLVMLLLRFCGSMQEHFRMRQKSGKPVRSKPASKKQVPAMQQAARPKAIDVCIH